MVEGRAFRPVIDPDLCRTCRVCVRGCPAESITEYREEEDSLRGALYTGQGAKNLAREKSGLPPCQEACPVHLETGRYARLVAEGRFPEALEVIRKDLPFPGTLGRICHRPCEKACLRGAHVDEAVALCALKAFVAEHEQGRRKTPPLRGAPERGRRVAVIGGGPSGMACALDLRRAGYGVTIFEASDRLGGMLYWAVPAYRLPRQVLERETSLVGDAGIEVRYGTVVGRDISMKEVLGAFDAVYVGCGAQAGARLGLPHEDAPGVRGGVEFLEQAHEGGPIERGEKVVVVGGGNVAIDAALTAKKIGAKEVRIACLEKRGEMAAAPWEVAQARKAGVRIEYGWGPKRFLTRAGRVRGIELQRCASVFDGQGRFNPVYKEHLTRVLDADTVIVAIGQTALTGFLRGLEGLDLDEAGWVKADPMTLETGVPGLFAGGDAVGGPGTAINAIADGKRAAVAIDRYLSAMGPRRGKKGRSAPRGEERDGRAV